MTTTFNQTYSLLPTNTSGCLLWLDASDLTTLFTDTGGTTPVTATGQSVAYWKDKSTQANNATNSANQPTVKYNGLNELPVLSFNGTQYLQLSALKLPNGSTPFTFFFLLKTTSSSTQVYFSYGSNPAETGKFPQFYFVSYKLFADLYGASAISDATVYNNQFIVNSLTAGSRFNGYDYTNTYSTTNNINISLNTGTANGYIGVSLVSTTLNFYFTGEIAEIIAYDRILSTDERQQIEGYLAWKWALTGSFPSSFPYISNRPFMNLYPLPGAITKPVSVFNNPTNPFVAGSTARISALSWLPTRIAGISLWLDAADKTTLTGSTVTSWTDKSGAGNNATASSGPTQSLYGRFPVLAFNGSSQFMTSPNTVPRTTHTLVAVHRPAVINGNTQGNTSLFRYQSSTYIVFPYMNTTTPRGYITDADGTGTGSLDYLNSTLVENSVTTSFNLIMAVIDSSTQTIYKNGTQQSTASKTLTGATSDSLTIGRYTPGLGEYYQGDLAEMIVYPSALTTFNRQQVEGYLAWKWGLQGSLPNTHPYKLFPPSP